MSLTVSALRRQSKAPIVVGRLGRSKEATLLDLVATWGVVAIFCLPLAYVAVRVEWGHLHDLFDPTDLQRRHRARLSSLVLPWAAYATTVVFTAAILSLFGDQLESACVRSDLLG